jgi:5-formyltetrahydrofolate cyclo-ligase
VLLFHPLSGEADLLPLLESEPAKRWVFPRVDGENLSLHEWHPTYPWLSGAFGIREPDPMTWPMVSPEEIDLALVPGLAFDSLGRRLGRGKGFYDRFLGSKEFRGLKIGIGPLVESIPTQDHDISMDAVLAPEGLFLVSGSVLDKAPESR